jgi:ABC-type multidrug transport system ATPase subunit
VLQDDLHIPILSVEETLRYASWTRMPHNATTTEREERVQFLLDEMGLTLFKDKMIGNEAIPGISGGQKKRVSIAVEIMSSPTFIFLDGKSVFIIITIITIFI